MTIDQELLNQAADWHAAMAGDDPDFEGFTAWLETSPNHARAYDDVIMLDDLVGTHKPAIQAALPANDVGESKHQQRRHFLAAAVAMALAIPGALWFGVGNSPVEFQSEGSPMQVALDVRTTIELDRNSLLRHIKNETDKVELAQGAAHFSVTHDPTHRFTVKAGDVSIVDLGTKFEIQRNGDQVGISVAEGAVAVAVSGKKLTTLRAGQRAYIEGGVIKTGLIDAASVASWRKGQLVYRNAPLSQVVKELSRYTPVPITVDPSLADRQFSGVLTIGDGHALDRNLADFMGLARIEQGKSVQIGARP